MAGCGWHLEGTAQQMYQSLAETLGTLPPQTVRGAQTLCGLCFLWEPSRPAQVQTVDPEPRLPAAAPCPLCTFPRRCSVATSTH